MEFPHLGKHCSESSCNRLDFLPVKCDSCYKVFCISHMLYNQHKCEAAYKKDVQVPVCPLCNKPIPVNKGEIPDIKVGEHMDDYCQSDPAKQRRIYVNRCSVKSCKTKELIKVTCSTCNQNFCLKHRHPESHSCQKVSIQNGSHSSNLVTERRTPSVSTSRDASFYNNLMQSEDEALARALHSSLNENYAVQQNLNLEEDQDPELALAIAESEREYRRQQEMQGKKDKCVVI
ncbi:AN1-type zinc finger protein 2A [Chamberlinius hualienensis]